MFSVLAQPHRESCEQALGEDQDSTQGSPSLHVKAVPPQTRLSHNARSSTIRPMFPGLSKRVRDLTPYSSDTDSMRCRWALQVPIDRSKRPRPTNQGQDLQIRSGSRGHLRRDTTQTCIVARLTMPSPPSRDHHGPQPTAVPRETRQCSSGIAPR